MSNVADVKRKAIKIKLGDGVERELRFTLNALAELEDRYGTPQAAFDKLEKEQSMKALRFILWAGMIHDSPDLTEMQVGNLIDTANMQEMIDSISTAFDSDMVQGEALPVGETVPNA